jgi:hypothetical protein
MEPQEKPQRRRCSTRFEREARKLGWTKPGAARYSVRCLPRR